MTHIALLRAVNLGPHNKVGMADLRELAIGLGFLDVRTLLQSGNLLFRSAGRATANQLERQIEQALRDRLDVDTDVFVRTSSEWSAIVAANPFPDVAKREPARLTVAALKTAPDRAAVAALQKAIQGDEVVKAVGRCAYVVYPDGIGRSWLTTARLEKGLGTRATVRSWNTALRLASLAET